jgi:hypothetical protein
VGFAVKDDKEGDKSRELVTRWKLDLTEGSERQRRRLLPNYEFHSLYNVDENDDGLAEDDEEDDDVDAEFDTRRSKRLSTVAGKEFQGGRHSVMAGNEMQSGHDSQKDFFVSDQLEATAELLKELNIKKVNKKHDEDVDDDIQTEATAATGSSSNEFESVTKEKIG